MRISRRAQPFGRSRNPEMSISFNLDDEPSARLEERARELGVDARKLAKAAVNDLLTRPAEDFEYVCCALCGTPRRGATLSRADRAVDLMTGASGFGRVAPRRLTTERRRRRNDV